MAGQLFVMPRVVGLDAGVSLPGALLYFYEAGGAVVPKNTYSDAALVFPNANPVEADADGLFGPIYVLPDAYYVALKTSTGVQVWTQDNVNGRSEHASAHMFSVRRSSTQTATSGANTLVALNVEDIDTDAQFDATTDFRFEPTILSSVWEFFGEVSIQSMTGILAVDIFTSQGGGTSLGTATLTLAGTTGTLSVYGVNSTPFAAGDYVYLNALHTHGSDRTLTGRLIGKMIGLV